MPRLNLTMLPKPPVGYDPGGRQYRKCGGRFETKNASAVEDAKRQKLVSATARKPAATRLKSGIARARTPASSVYMQKQRRRIVGHLWKLTADANASVSFFTLIPRNWEIRAGRLDKFDPQTHLESLRQCLIRGGARPGDGWMIMAIHGEYEPNEGVYRLHVHGLACGGMIAAVDGLRCRKQFKSTRPANPLEKIYQRVRMTRKRLKNLPEPISYIFQSFWPERPIILLPTGEVRRVRAKGRLREPCHTEMLLWLNRWSLDQTTLMMGMEVRKHGLHLTPNVHE
jgi:hypothetical protein